MFFAPDCDHLKGVKQLVLKNQFILKCPVLCLSTIDVQEVSNVFVFSFLPFAHYKVGMVNDPPMYSPGCCENT